MSGLGGLNKSKHGVVMGLVQLQLPVVKTPADLAREAAYKGAEIIIRTAGYTAPIRHAWHITNQANAFQNLAYTANVCMCGSDGSFDSMGEGMFCNFDGTVLVQGGAQDCPYTYMHDMAAGRYQLPWKVDITDGTSCGFEVPTRSYIGPEKKKVA